MDNTARAKLVGWVSKLLLLGSFGHQFFYWVQENAYGRPNFLKPISDLIDNQVVLTSLFGSLSGLGILTMGWLWLWSDLERRLQAWFILLPGSFGLILLTVREYYQFLHPVYYDDNAVDMFMGLLAYAALWLVVVKFAHRHS